MIEDSHKTQSTDTLLAVMSEQLKHVLESVRKIETKLDSKVDIVDFVRLEKALDEHKRDSDSKHKETTDKVNSHAVKLGIGGALLTAGSWLLSLIK